MFNETTELSFLAASQVDARAQQQPSSFPGIFFPNDVDMDLCQHQRANRYEWLTGVRGKALVLRVMETAVDPEAATLNDRFLQIQAQ